MTVIVPPNLLSGESESIATLETLTALERGYRDNLQSVWNQLAEVLPIVLSLTSDSVAAIQDAGKRSLSTDFLLLFPPDFLLLCSIDSLLLFSTDSLLIFSTDSLFVLL